MDAAEVAWLQLQWPQRDVVVRGNTLYVDGQPIMDAVEITIDEIRVPHSDGGGYTVHPGTVIITRADGSTVLA